MRVSSVYYQTAASQQITTNMSGVQTVQTNHGVKKVLLDPSDKFRPEKEEALFRDYSNSNEFFDRVKRTYSEMHTHQSYQYATEKMEQYCKFNHGEYTIVEVLEKLNEWVDESDPDINVPNAIHGFQTAERIREDYPDNEWLQVVGLIHDTGKILAKWGEPQWSTTGDTFPVGCGFSDKCVFGKESFKDNQDYDHPVYSTQFGIYEENCGLDKLTMAWGHDEYLYQVLMNHKGCRLPKEGLNIIRFHSFYPWHTGGDYSYLCKEDDLENMKWIDIFKRVDLYSKADTLPDIDALMPYYKNLLDIYVPGKIKW